MLKIITNNHVRNILYWQDLTETEKEDYDWIVNNDHNPEEFEFFRYKDQVYSLSEFLYYGKGSMMGKLPADFNGWDSYMSDSLFSGILIKFPDPNNWDYENGIIVGWYYA